MKAVWILTSSLQAGCTNWPRKWKAQMPQQDISSKWQETPRWPKLTSCIISALNYPMASIKRESHKPSKSKHTRRMGNKDLQANTRRVLTLDWPTNTRIGVANVVIQHIWKGSSVQPKNTSAKHASSLATTQAYASKKHNKSNLTTSTGNPLYIN